MTASLWRWSRRLGVITLAVVIASRLLQGARRQPGGPAVTRCPIHGVAYDVNIEMCPECAKS